MINKILQFAYYGVQTYKIYSNTLQNEYYLYKDNTRIKTAKNINILKKYIQQYKETEGEQLCLQL